MADLERPAQVDSSAWAAYAAVVERLPDAALLYDGAALLHTNPAGRVRLEVGGVLGPGESVEGVDLYAAVVPDDRSRLVEAMAAAGEGRSVGAMRLTFDGPLSGQVVASCSFHPLALGGRAYVQVLARDVTARVHAEQTLAASEAQFRAVFDHSPVGVAIVEEQRFAVVNPAMCRILGRPAQDLVGRSADDVTHPEDVAVNRSTTTALDEGAVLTVRKRYVRPDGTVVWGELTAVRISGGERLRTLVHLRDVTQEREAAQRLRDMALRDALTGLGNRTLLEDRLALVLAHRPEVRNRVAVLFIDLDGFKRINDALGHAVGDGVLRAVARRITEAVRPADTVSRWGGDEFVVLLDGVRSADEVLLVVQRIEGAIARPIPHRDDELLVTASVGIAHAEPQEARTAAELLHEADVAMYRAKQSGRNRHSVFDAALREAALGRTRVEALLRTAVDDDRVVLHFQPLVDLVTRRVVGAEALLRLRDDDGSLLYPDRFLDIAQDTGLMVGIEHVVLERACQQAATWLDWGHDLTVSINVCAQQLSAVEDFEAQVLKALSVSGLPPDRLVCEVTEHALIDTSARTVAGVTRLRAAGVEFSVDDFGTGYASMTYLQVLPVQELKVDRRFVARAQRDRPAAAIVRAVAGMAAELGMRCVAEGVEDEETHLRALHLGAGYGQGYHYARPGPAEDLERLLEGSANDC